MMKHIQLLVGTRRLERTKSGNVFGPIQLEIDGHSFPGKGWTDFVLAFVRAWIEALIEIASNATKRERVFFMDGPYIVEISRLDRTLVELRLLEDRRAGEVLLMSVKSDIRSLLADAIVVSEELLSECRQRAWSTNDTGPLLAANQIGAELCHRLEK